MGEPISDEDARRLQEGISKHERTTRNAEQAARTALETRNAARSTVEALHVQEAQLRRIGGQYEELEVELTRAEAYTSWLTACCLCKCCVDDAAPARRVPKGGGVGLDGFDGVAPLPQTMKTRDNYGVRPETGAASNNRNQTRIYAVGQGLGGPVEDHLKQETQKQDDAISTIEEVLGDLKVAATDMNAQLKRSEALEERVTVKNELVHDRVHNVYQGMRRA